MVLDDVNGPEFHRNSSWQRTIQTKDGHSMTEAVQFTETGHDVMEPNEIAIQTETDEQKPDGDVIISEYFIKMIEDSIVEAEKTRKLFDKLLPFHTREAARIQLARTVPVTAIPTDALPVRKMIVGSNGRVALLLASDEHETWCSHNAHVVVCHWNKVVISLLKYKKKQQYSLPQAVCPTAAAWNAQGLLAVASIAGNVNLYHGQITLYSAQVHEGPVTAIDWTGREILTSGTDGCVILSTLKGTTIEKEKVIRLAVSDLPRQIRRGAPGSRALGIVSLSRRGKDLLVASETGGIWKLQLPELSMVPSMATPVPIQDVLLLPADRIVLKDVDQHVFIMASDGTLESESLLSSSRWLFTNGSLLISSDEEVLSIVDTGSLKELCRTNLKLVAVASSGSDEILILNEHNELQLYGISY